MKTLKDFDLEDKRILVRVDFNVPLDEKGKILDDFRIQQSLSTIKYLKEKKAKAILISHLGGEPVKNKKHSLEKVALKLQDLVGQKVIFLKDCIGKEIEKKVKKMGAGEITLLENLRFYKEEKETNLSFAKELAKLGDIFLNDAFSVCHRPHASVVGIPNYLPSGAGLLLEKEVEVLSKILKKPERPFIVILGGVKVESKMKAIPPFLDKADFVLLGGIIPELILRAKGISLRGPLPSIKMIERAKEIKLTNPKLRLPIDVLVSLDTEKDYLRSAPLGEVRKEESILDIGEETIQIFSNIISKAETIVWAGPLGRFEEERFAQGTKSVAKVITRNEKAFKVAGGGETSLALKKFSLREKFDFVSTGGGALLEFLSGEKLPGLEALERPSLALSVRHF